MLLANFIVSKKVTSVVIPFLESILLGNVLYLGLEKENKDLKAKLGSVRVKLGVANANYNVGKHETDDLRKSHQENQIQIARFVRVFAVLSIERFALIYAFNVLL